MIRNAILFLTGFCLLFFYVSLGAKDSQRFILFLQDSEMTLPAYFVKNRDESDLGAKLLAQVLPQTAPVSTQTQTQSSPQPQTQTQTQTQSQTQTQTQPLYIGFPMQISWKLSTNGPVIGRPQPEGSYVYCVSKPGAVYKVEQSTGKQVWRRNVGDSVEEAFLVLNKVIYAGTQRGLITALDADRGREIWTEKIEEESFLALPAYDEKSLYLAGVNGNIVSVHRRTGKVQWKFKANGSCHTSPFTHENTVFAGCDDRTLYALDSAAGFVKWKYTAGAEIKGSPVADFHHVFFGSEDTYFYCLNKNDGSLRWRFKTGGAVRGVPIFYYQKEKQEPEGIIFASFDNFLYNLKIKDGGRKWLSLITARVYNRMHFDRALIFVAPFGSGVLGYDPHTGERVGEFSGAGRIRSAPITANDMLFVGLNNGDLLCLRRQPPPAPQEEEGAVPIPPQTQTAPQTQTSETQPQTEAQTQTQE